MQKLIMGLVSLSLVVSSGAAIAENSKKDNFWSPVLENSAKKNTEAGFYTQGFPVFSSPFLGIRSKFDGSDLIVNVSTMNEDLRFLEEQQKLNKTLEQRHLPGLDRPLIEIGGDVVGQAFWESSYRGPSHHDINLTSARFDVFSRVSPWAMGYISTDFDNNPLDESVRGAGFRLGNSRIFLKRAFLTIGNLEESPVYFSLGQMYVPFGRYSTSTVTTPDTVALGQTNTRAALLGFSYEGFFGSVYAFRGDSDVSSTGINQLGVNGGYRYSCDPMTIELGGGFIANLADSTGMQLTGHRGGSEFSGFGEAPITEKLDHRVPAYDAHVEFNYDKFGAAAEYIAATRHFDFDDLNFNGEGAMPSALHVEANYKFDICDRPASVAVAYGHTSEALALRLPKNSFFGTFNISLWKNTIQSLEYRYDQNYHRGDTSGGAALLTEDTIINGNTVEEGTVINGAGPVGGGHRNLILAQIGVYF